MVTVQHHVTISIMDGESGYVTECRSVRTKYEKKPRKTRYDACKEVLDFNNIQKNSLFISDV